MIPSAASPLPAPVRFACTDCGRCCTGGPGAVRITEEEITTLATHLGRSREETVSLFVRPFPENLPFDTSTYVGPPPRWSLTEKNDHSCIFFKDGRCSVYAARPSQCRTFPFWFINLRNEESWARTSRNCPGIGQGPVHTPEEILGMLDQSPI